MKLNKQVDDLETQLESEKKENENILKDQNKALEDFKKEAEDSKDFGGKMRMRIRDLEAELQDSLDKLELMQRGIDPNKKQIIVRKKNFSPAVHNSLSRKSNPRKNNLSNNKRVSSLPNNRKAPSYTRPTRQPVNRHQTTSRSPAARLGGYGYKKPGNVSGSNGPRSNSGSKKRSTTKPQVSGVFGRLYQSKQRDSPLRTNANKVSPGYRQGGYKRSPANRAQNQAAGAQGVKRSSPGTRATTNFQVSSRLYPGPGGRSKDSSNSRSKREDSKTNNSKIYNNPKNTSKERSNSYGRVPRPFQRSGSKNRSTSKDRVKPPASSNSGVFDRLYGSGANTKAPKSKPQRPPAKPSVNNFIDANDKSNLDIINESIGEESKMQSSNKQRRENNRDYPNSYSKQNKIEDTPMSNSDSTRDRIQANLKAANTSMERRLAAKENLGNFNIVTYFS